jgi:hypothetical protein
VTKTLFFDLYFTGEYADIPKRMQDAMTRYVLEGVQPGHFLTAVITNDLRGAVNHADEENLPLLRTYVRWFFNVAPGSCYGSAKHMEEWINAANQS